MKWILVWVLVNSGPGLSWPEGTFYPEPPMRFETKVQCEAVAAHIKKPLPSVRYTDRAGLLWRADCREIRGR